MRSWDCFSSPTMGLISVSMSTRTMWMEGAPAFSFTPKAPPLRTSSGVSSFISSAVGITTP